MAIALARDPRFSDPVPPKEAMNWSGPPAMAGATISPNRSEFVIIWALTVCCRSLRAAAVHLSYRTPDANIDAIPQAAAYHPPWVVLRITEAKPLMTPKDVVVMNGVMYPSNWLGVRGVDCSPRFLWVVE